MEVDRLFVKYFAMDVSPALYSFITMDV
jgi:hypothetical protein